MKDKIYNSCSNNNDSNLRQMNLDFYFGIITLISNKVISYYEAVDLVDSYENNIEKESNICLILLKKIDINLIQEVDYLVNSKIKTKNLWLVFISLFITDSPNLLLVLKGIERTKILANSNKNFSLYSKEKLIKKIVREFFKSKKIIENARSKIASNVDLENDIDYNVIGEITNSIFISKLEQEYYNKYTELSIILKQSENKANSSNVKETYLFRSVINNVLSLYPFTAKEKTNRVVRNFSNRESIIRISVKLGSGNTANKHINCVIYQAFLRYFFKLGLQLKFIDVEAILLTKKTEVIRVSKQIKLIEKKAKKYKILDCGNVSNLK